jgi:hypothetical protein
MINSSQVQLHNRATGIMGAWVYRGFQILRRFADGDDRRSLCHAGLPAFRVSRQPDVSGSRQIASAVSMKGRA